MSGTAWSARALVERLGPHSVTSLGIDLTQDSGVGAWLVAACLLGGRVPEEASLAGFRGLRDRGWALPEALTGADFGTLVDLLDAAGIPKPEGPGRVLVRVCGALADGYSGSVDDLAQTSDGIEELAGRLAALAPGFGAAAVARFLRPLRERWPSALEIPLHPSAHAAAVHLGWIDEGADTDGEPGALSAFVRDEADAPPLYDVEAALERLGAAACRRNRASRCPLRDGCPARS